jgi:hypothetical protein
MSKSFYRAGTLKINFMLIKLALLLQTIAAAVGVRP